MRTGFSIPQRAAIYSISAIAGPCVSAPFVSNESVNWSLQPPLFQARQRGRPVLLVSVSTVVRLWTRVWVGPATGASGSKMNEDGVLRSSHIARPGRCSLPALCQYRFIVVGHPQEPRPYHRSATADASLQLPFTFCPARNRQPPPSAVRRWWDVTGHPPALHSATVKGAVVCRR